MEERITEADKSLIQKYFGKTLGELDQDSFQAALKEAKKTYHPDKFSHYEDELVVEMAKERFQQIQVLEKKIEAYLKIKDSIEGEGEDLSEEGPEKGYYTEGIHIDIQTTDKQLKYRIFKQPVIYRGDRVKIGQTGARLIALEEYSPRISAGFKDNVKVKLIFGVEDSVYEVVDWIFKHISGKTSSFVIEGKIIQITPGEILQAIKKEAFLELGEGK